MSVAIAFLVRLMLVALFLPFSAVDKVLNHAGAVSQASGIGIGPGAARAMVAAGLFVEVAMSLCVLIGFADRLAALVLAFYCVVTALMFKRFWAMGDFALSGPSRGRETFWDFWKNVALAGGFLLVTFGATSASVDAFFAAPFASSNPYATRSLE